MNRRTRAAVVAALLGAGGTLAFACAPTTAPVGAGGECFVATDCEPGLVCVAQRSGARECTSDLSQVVGQAPPEAGRADAPRDAPPTDGPAQESGQDSGMDTSMPDTSVADAAEAG